MNSAARFFQRILSRPFRMNPNEDYLYYSHEKLLNFITNKQDANLGVKEYLENVKYASIQDFSHNLEWFNVSEPLSFNKHLKGKLVVLDFFTYCCINCMHILPDLRHIENMFSVEDGLVVVGVHSAKFENEKISSNILAAVQRYNINHPVVNDCNSEMWKNCDVHCWPTLLLLGPNANPIVMLTGEGHRDDLVLYIRNALEYYKSKNMISNHKLPLKSAYHLLPDLKGPLLFPGKIANFCDENGCEILAISDTGNNRILIVQEDGTIIQQVGGAKVGFRDGNLEEAEFNSPQGLVFQNQHVIFVADTENHAIRKVDLMTKKVITVAGTGIQGHDRQGGKLWRDQVISSPWDVCIFKCPDMDMTFHPEGNPPIRDVLLIAMAGTHQIWALFLDDTVWWKCKKYPSGTCINIAGSGREENRNNNYPHAAAFAQPSGLALCQTNRQLYIADSESSSIRRLSLEDGKVTPVVGGDRNPNNLFSFGDKDGALFDAKLQHVLGVAISRDGKSLYIADTYNHKLKRVDVCKNSVTSLRVPTTDDVTDGDNKAFNEPGGLCVSSDNKKMYVADTNNHSIKILHFDDSLNVTNTKIMKLKDASTKTTAENTINKTNYKVYNRKKVNVSNKGGKLVLHFKIDFENGIGLTEGAPQFWLVDLPDSTWSAVPKSGDNNTCLSNMDTVVNVPPSSSVLKETFFDLIFDIVTCTEETCLPKSFIVRVPIHYTDIDKIRFEEKLCITIGENDIKIL